MATKGSETKIFHLRFFVVVVSRIQDRKKSGAGIQDKYPGSATLPKQIASPMYDCPEIKSGPGTPLAMKIKR